MITRNSYLALALAGAFFVSAAIVCPLVGSFRVGWGDYLGYLIGTGDENSPAYRVLAASRVPRVAFALVAGAVLGVAGVMMQTLLRNPLAEPFTLGISGGATLTVLVAVQAGLGAGVAAGWVLPVASLIGALLALVIVLGLSRAGGGLGRNTAGQRSTSETLILCGVVVNTVCGAAILLIQYLSNPFESAGLLRWILGGVDVPSLTPSLLAGGALILVLVWLLGQSRTLDVMQLEDRAAHHLGVDVQRMRTRLLVVASGLTALVVSAAGPIAFVGLIVPHLARMVGCAGHGVLIPVAALGGGGFLAYSDLAARTVAAPAEFPVGILTALLGGPFFLALLARRSEG